MPFADDTIKCELKPLRRSNYFPLVFSDADWAKLEKVFPNGVCDYTKPGVDRVKTGTWLDVRGRAGRAAARAGAGVAAAGLDDSLGLPSTKRCVGKRGLRFRLRGPAGEKLVSARLYVNGKRVRTLRGRKLSAPVVVRRAHGKAMRLRIVAFTRGGRRMEREQPYRTCVAKTRGRVD